MAKWLMERRLKRIGQRLAALREELRVTEAQLGQLDDEADDSRIKALVSESPLDDKTYRDDERHASRMAGHRADLLREIASYEARQDLLLDQLTG